MIVIERFGNRASISNGVWTSEDASFQRLLRSWHEEWASRIDNDGPADPDPELSAATGAVKELGGKIVDLSRHTPPDTSGDPPDAVY